MSSKAGRSAQRRSRLGGVAIVITTISLPLGCAGGLASRGSIFGSPLPSSPVHETSDDGIFERLGRLFQADASRRSAPPDPSTANPRDLPIPLDT